MPDAWEEDFFFAPEKLADRLQELREWEDLSATREAELRQIWAKKTIRSGATEPLTRGMAGAIRVYYFPENPFIEAVKSLTQDF